MESKKTDEPTRERLAAFLTKTAYGGSIVSTAALSETEIAVARCCGRMIVIDGGFGFVYLPPKEEAP